MEKTVEKKAETKNGVKRMIFTVLSILIEIVVILVLIMFMDTIWGWIYNVTHILALFLVLFIYGKHETPSIKMPWIMLILLLPICGTTLYLLVGLNGSTNKMRHRYETVEKQMFPKLPKNDDVLAHAAEVDKRLANIGHYVKEEAGYPMYENTKVTYYDDGEKGFEAQKEELAKAKEFIFMEYHAIEDAECWQELEAVLVDRVKAGVEVRVFYDDMGSIGFIDKDFVKKLEGLGIKARVFNPFAPGLNIFLNNRDHRKVTVIDGKVGFTGGYNLANEYFHRTEPYGFWKDTGVKLVGDAVDSLSIIFLEMWNAMSKFEELDFDYEKYLNRSEPVTDEDTGFVQPYGDSPLDQTPTGEDVYISMVEQALDYCWFVTPYLIITDEMIHAISLAAKRGVDVRIITPGIPDKKTIYSVTRSYYNALVRNGVRIFEYTPGFCHCKMSVSDDIAATCGTINMDYRSLYHHFENGCLMADCDAVMDIKSDFEDMMKQSREVTFFYREGRGKMLRFSQMLLRLFASLL